MIKSFSKLFFIVNLILITDSFAARRTSSLDNFSNAPVITVGGFIDTAVSFRKQDGAFENERLPDAADIDDDALPDTDSGTTNNYNSSPDFTNDSEIHIKVGGINQFGMKYGAVVEIEADTSTSARNEGFNADKSYIFTESRSGKFEIGTNIGANQKMKVGPANFARAAGGINGRYLEYINLPMLADSTNTGVEQIGACSGYRIASDGTLTDDTDCDVVKLPSFILVPRSPISHGGYARSFYDNSLYEDASQYDNTVGDASYGFNKGRSNSQLRDGSFGDLEDANKVSYYSPRISGWQLGLSYAPDSGNSGSSASITGDSSGDIENVVSWGVNYSNNFGHLGLAASATGENGKFEQSATATTQRNDLSAYEFGAMATYFGFTLGGSYGIWGDSLTPKSGIYSCQYDDTVAIANQDCDGSDDTYANGLKKFDDATYWTAGVAYEFGPVAFSATHLNSEFQSNSYKATSFGADYRMAKGLMPYIEFTQFEFESNQPIASDYNSAVSPLTGNLQLKDNDGYVVLTGLLFSF